MLHQNNLRVKIYLLLLIQILKGFPFLDTIFLPLLVVKECLKTYVPFSSSYSIFFLKMKITTITSSNFDEQGILIACKISGSKPREVILLSIPLVEVDSLNFLIIDTGNIYYHQWHNQFNGLCHFYLYLLNINHGIKNQG